MRRFRFQLQTLLELREVKEKEIQNELSRLINIQNRERIKQQDYRRRIVDESAKFNQKMREGKYSYSEAVMFERFVDFANRVIVNAQAKIDSMEPEIQRVRERLIEATKERRVIERLKEKRWNEYLYELNREIQKEQDDLNQRMYLMRKISSSILPDSGGTHYGTE
jgi:flagellar FliJ protein